MRPARFDWPPWPTPIALAVLLVAALVGAARATDPTPLEAAVLAHLGEGRRVEARGLVEDATSRQRPGSGAARRMALLGAAIDAADAVAQGADTAPVVSEVAGLSRRVEPGDLPLIDAAAQAIGPARGYLDPARSAAWLAIRPAIGVGHGGQSTGDRPGLEPAALRALARDGDARTRQRAVAALAEWAHALRAEVAAGGSLDASEQEALADAALIEVLVARLAERAGDGATDLVPADLLARSPGCSTAFHALVACEAGALPALEPLAERPGVREVRAAIGDAIAARLRRWPKSTWSSAVGEVPVVPRREACACAAPLPPGARFCPTCGLVARVPCRSCGALRPAGDRPCPGCGAEPGAVASPCDRCQAPLRPTDIFCPQCGARPVPPGTPGSRRP